MKSNSLIILSPAFPGNESEEQSPWLPAQQSLLRCLNANFPHLQITIIAFKFPLDKREYSWFGNRVIPLGGGLVKGWRNVHIWYRAFRVLRKLKKSGNITGIISFWCNECCLAGSYFSRWHNVKHLCWICGQDAKKENKFVRLIKPKSKELVAMSDFLMEEFSKNHFIRPKYLIPDGIETTLFPVQQQERDIAILGAGNLVPLKRYNIFIEVVTAITNKHPLIKVVLCGGGSEERALEKQAVDAGLQNTVMFTGLIPHKTVLSYMQRAKVFLHTSEYEGFGNVCIEALYAGAHVISFTRPMNRDIPHWHTVSAKEEMISKAMEILENEQTNYTSILPFDMNDSAKKFIEILTSGKD
ncbi:MAG TPA: glycosyltransferase [Chitinophagaceae bacterium]|nr:glycosyltransferase [Chitinophagaceae bacterium]